VECTISLHLDYTELMTEPATGEETMIHHRFLSKPSFPKITDGVTCVTCFHLGQLITAGYDTLNDAGRNMMHNIATSERINEVQKNEWF